jgi:hypothetical protein
MAVRYLLLRNKPGSKNKLVNLAEEFGLSPGGVSERIRVFLSLLPSDEVCSRWLANKSTLLRRADTARRRGAALDQKSVKKLTKTKEADEFLKKALANGPVRQDQIAAAAQEHGITKITLRRAFV